MCILSSVFWIGNQEPIEYYQKTVDETQGPFVIQVPTTYRYLLNGRLNPISPAMFDIKGSMEGLDYMKGMNTCGKGGKEDLTPWLCDLRFIAVYGAASINLKKDDRLAIYYEPSQAADLIVADKLVLSGWPEKQDLLHSLKPFSGIGCSESFKKIHVDQLVGFLQRTMKNPGIWKDAEFKTLLQGQKDFLENADADKSTPCATFADSFLIRELMKRLQKDQADIFSQLTFVLFQEKAFVGGSLLGMHWTCDNKEEQALVESLVKLLLNETSQYAAYTTMLPADKKQLGGYFEEIRTPRKKSNDEQAPEQDASEEIKSHQLQKAVGQMYSISGLGLPRGFSR